MKLSELRRRAESAGHGSLTRTRTHCHSCETGPCDQAHAPNYTVEKLEPFILNKNEYNSFMAVQNKYNYNLCN